MNLKGTNMFSTGYSAGIFMREYKTEGAAVNSIVSFMKSLTPGETLKLVEQLNSGLDTYFFKYSADDKLQKAFVSAVSAEIDSFEKGNERVNLEFLGRGLDKFFEKQSKLRKENELNSKNGISQEQAVPPICVLFLQIKARRAIESFKVETMAFTGAKNMGGSTPEKVNAQKAVLKK